MSKDPIVQIVKLNPRQKRKPKRLLKNILTGNVFEPKGSIKSYMGSSNRTSDGKPIFKNVSVKHNPKKKRGMSAAFMAKIRKLRGKGKRKKAPRAKVIRRVVSTKRNPARSGDAKRYVICAYRTNGEHLYLDGRRFVENKSSAEKFYGTKSVSGAMQAIRYQLPVTIKSIRAERA